MYILIIFLRNYFEMISTHKYEREVNALREIYPALKLERQNDGSLNGAHRSYLDILLGFCKRRNQSRRKPL